MMCFTIRCVSDSDGISWLPPVMCFSIIVGLGLDYDVFLISRVFEFRDEGYTDHSAAVKVCVRVCVLASLVRLLCLCAYIYCNPLP
jgi:uncharacterized membrane protein YdfJ with MMPL/SSD domain